MGILLPIIHAMALSPELTSWEGSPLCYIPFSDEYFNLKVYFLLNVAMFLSGIYLLILILKRDKEVL